MKPEIFLVGAGGHARSVIDVIEAEGKWRIAGFVDIAKVESQLCGYHCLGDDTELVNVVRDIPQAVVAVGQIGKAEARKSLFDQLVSLGAQLPIIISPRAIVSPRSSIGRGTVVMHGAVVNSGATVGRNCIVNSLALVEHDSVVEDHCHISTGARVNGGCSIGAGSFIGSGAILFQGVRLGEKSVVPAGKVIDHSIGRLRDQG